MTQQYKVLSELKMSPSGLHVNKPVIAVVVLGVIVVILFWMRHSSSPAVMEMPDRSDWKAGDRLEVPETAKDDHDKVKIEHVTDKKIKVGETEITVAYREVKPENAKLDVLLLHGAAFKSKTWVDKPMFTMQLLHNLGYHAVAVDLPGYGDSSKGDVEPAAYMETVIQEFKLNAPVIVSPSMSGRFSLPYLFKDPKNVLSRSRGYVPVAPGTTDEYTPAQYQSLQIPALIVYGSKDKSLGLSSLKHLQDLPNRTVVEIEGGSHPCYLDKPDVFHDHLYTFLSSLHH